MRRTRFVSLLALLALVLAACGGEAGNGGGDGGTITIEGRSANDHGTTDVAGMDEIALELDDFYFSPTVLTGEAGQTIALNAQNEGDAPHTLTAGDVDAELAPGAGTTVQLTFPASGVLAFECRFHAGQGMRGALSVGPLSEAGGAGSTTEPPATTTPADGGGYGGY